MASKRYRHLKRGTSYTVIDSHASVQGVLKEGNFAVVYQGDDGHMWVRDKNEFFDGRFEPIDEQLELPLLQTLNELVPPQRP